MNLRLLLIVVVIFTFTLAVYPAWSQGVPASINYQGKLTDISGKPVANGSYEVQFKLYTVATRGIPFWTATAQTVQTVGGVFTAALSPLSAADLAGKTDVYLEMVVEKETLSPRTKLTSAPYSLIAGTVPDASLTLSKFNTSAAAAGQALIFNGTTAAWGAPTVPDGSLTLNKFDTTGAASGQALIFDGTAAAWGVPSVPDGSLNLNKLNTAGATSGQALIYNGTTSVWGTPAGSDLWVKSGSTMYSSLSKVGIGVINPACALDILADFGNAGKFTINNSVNSYSALDVSTKGTGKAGYFTVANASSTADALGAVTCGSGNALEAFTSGSGNAIYGRSTGTGGAGCFEANNIPINTSVVFATTTGDGDAIYGFTGGAGDSVCGYASGSGDAVRGYNNGTGHAGYFSIYNSSSTRSAVTVATNALGDGASYFVDNTSNGNAGVYIDHKGIGVGIHSSMTGAGRAGLFEINNSTNSRPALECKTNGTGDGLKLSVSNTSNINSGIFLEHKGSGNGVVSFMSGTGRAGFYEINNTASSATSLECKTNGTGAAFKAVGTTAAVFEGNVGIGTSSPASGYKLDVNGSIRCSSFTQYSDLRLKKDISTLTDALSTVMQLRGVSFNWQSDGLAGSFGEGRQIGFIAQEVEKVLPELVKCDDNGYFGVDYAAVAPVLVEAIKDQQNKIESLEKQNADLEKRLADLESVIAAMQTK